MQDADLGEKLGNEITASLGTTTTAGLLVFSLTYPEWEWTATTLVGGWLLSGLWVQARIARREKAGGRRMGGLNQVMTTAVAAGALGIGNLAGMAVGVGLVLLFPTVGYVLRIIQ